MNSLHNIDSKICMFNEEPLSPNPNPVHSQLHLNKIT
jgi:hypothetical protein